MESLVRNPPFVDGNKRTGIAAAALSLLQNGCQLAATNAEVEAFVLRVVEAEPDVAELAAWLRTHSLPFER